MRPRNLVFITLLALCHLQVKGQTLTNAVPPAGANTQVPSSSLPDDPEQEMLPIAQPEPAPDTGTRFRAAADNQAWAGNVWTGTGRVEFH
jgi:LPS-assembly protein